MTTGNRFAQPGWGTLHRDIGLALSLVLVMMLVVQAAAPGRATAQPGDGLEPEPGAVLTVVGWGDAAQQQIVQAALARFNVRYPDVTVTYQSSGTDYRAALRTALAAGRGPDVFMLDSTLLAALAPTGLLLDFAPLLDPAGVSRQDFPAALLAQWTTPDGQIVGLPKDFRSLALFYVPTLFEQAGVEPPDINWTLTDLEAAATAISESGVAVGLCTSPDVSRWPAYVATVGGRIMTDDYRAAAFNTPDVIAVTRFYHQLYLTGAGITPSDLGMGWCGEALGNEAVAMVVEGNWLIPYLTDNFPATMWSVAPLPRSAEGRSGNVLFQYAWSARAETPYPNAAALLVFYLTGEVNQRATAAATLDTLASMPAHAAVLTDPDFLATLDPAQRVLLEGVYAGQPFYFGAHTEAIIAELGSALGAIFLGRKTVPTALGDAAAAINTLVDAP